MDWLLQNTHVNSQIIAGTKTNLFVCVCVFVCTTYMQCKHIHMYKYDIEINNSFN